MTGKILEKHCTVVEGNKNEDVYLLHEFGANVSDLKPLARRFIKNGYSTIICEYPGHGLRLFEGVSWKKTLREMEGVMKERGKPSILVGSSAGGSIAITLGMKNDLVKKVFAISAPNKAGTHATRGKLHEDSNSIMPEKTATCKESNKDRFFLIHSKNDSIVKFQEFKDNKTKLCLPDENTLVVGKVKGVGFVDHLSLKDDIRTNKFIFKHLS